MNKLDTLSVPEELGALLEDMELGKTIVTLVRSTNCVITGIIRLILQ